MQKEFNVHQYPNGITLLHKQVLSTRIAHCGYIFDVGSRDENLKNQGLAHFWEHMAFKGTEKKKICFHLSLLYTYLERATNILTNISFFSTFPKKEIEKEKKVVIEEMH